MNETAGRKSLRVARTCAQESLAPAALRLLAMMAGEEAEVRPDPVEAGRLIVSRARRGVSLAAGRFDLAAAEALVRRDLAAWSGSGTARRLALTQAGRAHRRRAAAGADQAFLAQHADLTTGAIPGESGPQRVTLNAAESPLAWLSRRKDRDGSPLIDAAAREAGERLRVDLTLAALLPGVSMNWSAFGTGGGGPRDPASASDATIAARQRVRAAMLAVGPDFADLLFDLCGFLKGLEAMERDRGWPPRSAKVVVRLALARLADHYGLASEARGPERSRGLRLWRAVVGTEG